MSNTSRFIYASTALAERELKRFVRQRNRVFGALAQPILFWVMFGAGLNSSFQPASGSKSLGYAEYFFPGTVVLILLFTAIFATISVIDDRNEGFLQSVLVAPVPPSSIVVGKLAGATTLAVGQAILFLAFAPAVGIALSPLTTVLAVLLLALIALALTGLGFTIAWHLDSTQGFHAIMTAFLMPMWFLSGAFFPAQGVPSWLSWVITLNPLTYGVAAFRRVLYLDQPAVVSALPGIGLSMLVLVCFCLATFSAAYVSTLRKRPKNRS